MKDDEPLDRLAHWVGEARSQIPAQVNVSTTRSSRGKRTTVAIDHRLSCSLEAHEGWRVSTKRTYLPPAHFSSPARFYLKTAEHDRGRAIYCHELGVCEVVAAVSYHVDDRAWMPVLLTNIALREDTGDNAYLVYRTLAGALVLKQYVHAIAEKIGRGGYVDLDLANRERAPLVGRLGFQRAPKVRGYRPGGLHLRQPVPRG